MARSGRRYLDDVPDEVGDRLRTICLDFPDAYEQQAWAGTRWMVRKKTFAHVLAVARDEGDPDIVLSFRSGDEEAESLRRAGHPFFTLGWGRNAIGMVLDDSTDWDEVRELMTESFCVMAPKKLVALVDRPPE
jgi:predicted DNA-binding protein (MmcQ/YjbR family)